MIRSTLLLQKYHFKQELCKNKIIKFVNFSKFMFGSKINFRLLNKERKAAEAAKLKEIEKNNTIESKMNPKNFFYNSPVEAIKTIKSKQSAANRKKKETINMLVNLNLGTNKSEQLIRGICKLPGGSIKIPRICVFTSGHLIDVAKEAGADLIGDQTVLDDIKLGKFKFDKLVCSLDMLPTLKQLGRILGPKGLMPNQKVGTAAKGEDLEGVIKDLKSGSKEFKIDKFGQIQIPIGRENYPDENIYKNIDSFLESVYEKKPESVKLNYIKSAFLKTSSGLPLKLDVKSLDRKSGSYFINSV